MSVFGQGTGLCAMLHCGTKHGCEYAGSAACAGGAWPKIISQERSSKLGFIVRGRPKSLVKKSWVGICRIRLYKNVSQPHCTVRRTPDEEKKSEAVNNE